jgi:orotidine-5'-phosphate decarboxylase
MLTVHASGGSAMIEAARASVDRLGLRTRIVAVTVLTSLSNAELAQIGWTGDAATNAVRLARMASEAGAHGVVCSAHEAAAMRAVVGADGWVVTPGIRLPGDAAGDQSRVALPSDAAAWGASHAVIGRPILAAADRRSKWRELEENLKGAQV